MKIRITKVPKAQDGSPVTNPFIFPFAKDPRSYTLTDDNGMIDSTRGFVTKEDTQALGYDDFGNKTLSPEEKILKGLTSMGKIGSTIGTAANFGSAFTNMFVTNPQARRDNQRQMVNAGLTTSLQMAAPEDRGDFVVTGSRRGEFRPDQYVVNKGQYTGQFQPFVAEMGVEVIPEMIYSDFAMPAMAPMFEPAAPKATAAAQSSGSFRDFIADKESGGNYKALPKDKSGKLVSSAAGKYQFLWNKHKDWISKVTGVTTKQDFLNNPDAQEMAFDYWDQTVLTPTAQKIKEELGVPDSIDTIKAKIHFAGPTGAYKYYASGYETRDAFGTTTSVYRDGGENIDPMNPYLPSMPEMAYGGQLGYGLDLGARKVYTDMPEGPSDYIRTTMPEVDREDATIEAERGETLYGDIDNDGVKEHMKIGGKRHSEGGTPLAPPAGSFIFSDTKKMTIKDPEILKMFGKTSKATPAAIAKQYDVNKFKAVLDDPNADEMSKKTAQMMVDNFNKKLGALSVVQEAMKGFPQGIPSAAESVIPMAKFGGALTKYAEAGIVTSLEEEMDNRYPWLKPWVKSNTVAGRTSPTKKNTLYNGNVDNIYKNIERWEKMAGRSFDSLQDLQRFVYTTIEKDNPDAIKQMWKDWGHTRKGKNLTVDNFADNYMGARTAQMLGMDVKPMANPKGTPKPIDFTPAAPTEEKQEVRTAEGPKPGEISRPVGNQSNPGRRPFFNSSLFVGPERERFYAAPITAVIPEPTFMDPNRELAANAEMAAMNKAYMSSFGNPQAFMANASAADAKALENAANINARYQNANVGTANQFEGVQADIMNKVNAAQADRADKLFFNNEQGRKAYNNSLRTWLRNIDAVRANEYDNRSKENMLNAVNPFFEFQHGPGGANIRMRPGVDAYSMITGETAIPGQQGQQTMNSNQYLQLVEKYKSMYPNATPFQIENAIRMDNPGLAMPGRSRGNQRAMAGFLNQFMSMRGVAPMGPGQYDPNDLYDTYGD